MTDIRYLAPRTLDEAVSAYAAAGAAGRILAGGTDLLVQMRSGVVEPGVIVDIKKIAELTSIEDQGGGKFRVGAAVSGAALAEHAGFANAWPGVLEAINLIGSKQVQGRASAGGNLCNGSPAGDSVPAMVAAGATVTVQGPRGRREMKVEDVPAGPGRTNLEAGEILVSINFPARPAGSGDAYLRMIPRTEMDIAVVGCGVSLTMKEGVCTAARVGLGAVAPTVLLVEDAAKALIGSRLDDGRARRRCRCLPRRLPSDRRQARHHRLPHQGRRRALEARGRHCRRTRERGLRNMSKTHVTTTINGEPTEFLCDASHSMLDVLRNQLDLTGAKEGCGTGDCGACSITLDGRLVCSCLMLAVEAEGRNIGTIEGMSQGGKLHPLQQKFLEHAALQCGICTPGVLVAAKALLDKNPEPDRDRGALRAGWKPVPLHGL